MPENTLFSFYSGPGVEPEPEGSFWEDFPAAVIQRHWDGSRIPEPDDDSIHRVRITSVWNDSSVWFHFACRFDQLNVRPDWGKGGPIMNLWDTDVVEIFLRRPGQKGYFEFEAGPLGQWLDVRIYIQRREVDFNWASGMDVRTRLRKEEKNWLTLFRIPFSALTDQPDQLPRVEDVWRVNFSRILGREPDRRFLTWRPTLTPEPDFHVPDAFGNLVFCE